MKKEISSLIKKYAEVYKGFEKFQKKPNPLLPGGDQKTGVIAEYYAKCYIENTFKVTAEYARSGSTHDITYKSRSKRIVKVQVKGVSEHSRTRSIAPLNLKDKDGNKSFDELYLIDLDLEFQPVAFYINTYSQVIRKIKVAEREKIVGSKMKDTKNTGRNGSGIYDFNDNKIADLRKAIK